MNKNKNIKLQVLPNTERVIIRLVQQAKVSGLLVPGQLKAGENLHCGEIVHAGNTKFKVGQIVYYSEYSAAQFFNLGSVLRNEQALGEAMNEKFYIVAEDDIMAYEKELFEWDKEVEDDNIKEELAPPDTPMTPTINNDDKKV